MIECLGRSFQKLIIIDKKDVGGKSFFLHFKKFSFFFSKKMPHIFKKNCRHVIYSSHVHLVHKAVNRRVAWLDWLKHI